MDNLASTVRVVNQANGWNLTIPSDWDKDYKIPAVLALIHSEVSEALEAFRKGDKENFVEELADIKIEVNRKRSHRHGGKRI